MSVRDIPTRHWREFLDGFSRSHRAWLASVDRLDPGTLPQPRVVERPLRSIAPDFEGDRVVSIEVRFQQDSGTGDAVRVEEPSIIRVEESGEGMAQGLEIVDREGQCTRIRFRAAPPSEMLDGLAPGELAPE